MLELSTTATFDRLFSKLPKSVQRKAATKTDFFRENPFHPSLHTEKLHPKHHEVWSFRVDRAYASSSNLSVATMSNYGSLVTTTPFMTTICSDNLTPGTTSA